MPRLCLSFTTITSMVFLCSTSSDLLVKQFHEIMKIMNGEATWCVLRRDVMITKETGIKCLSFDTRYRLSSFDTQQPVRKSHLLLIKSEELYWGRLISKPLLSRCRGHQRSNNAKKPKRNFCCFFAFWSQCISYFIFSEVGCFQMND